MGVSFVVEARDEVGNVVRVAARPESRFGEVRNEVNRWVPAGFAVGEYGLVPEPFSHYIDDAPELFKGPGDAWILGDVFFDAIAEELRAAEVDARCVESKVIVLRVGALHRLGPRRRVAVLFPDESLDAIGHLGGVDPRLVAAASAIVGYDLWTAKDDDRKAHRVASLVVALGNVEAKLRAGAFDRRDLVAVAGVGCAGETAALIFVGSLTLEDALALGDARDALLSASSTENEGQDLGATSVIGLDRGAVDALCADHGAALTHELFDQGFVVAGADDTLDELERLRTPHVHGGAHTSKAAGAVGGYAEAVARASLTEPRCALYAGIDGEPRRTIDEIRAAVAGSIDRPVRWRGCCEAMVRDGTTHFVQAGANLATFLKLVDPRAQVLD